jgi:methionine-rich copper-binding protein CopC
MRRLLLLIVALAVLAAPAQAFAHATLLDPSPEYRERLTAGPAAVVLRFDQAVMAFPDSIVVRSGEGRVLSDEAVSGVDALAVLVPVRSLARGAYTVRWHVLSSDGHPISGVYTFGVRVAAPAPT